MKALNRAFEKALGHFEGDDSVRELLACMGEELECKRICIFEETGEVTYDNTYEWCRAGVVCEQILLQNIPTEKFDTWRERLIHHEVIVVRSADELKERDPDVYNLFIEWDIESAIVSLLAFHGVNLGFVILEDPGADAMADKDLIMPGIRYILSSMIHNRNMLSRVRRFGLIDALTGAGNRVSLKERIERIDHAKPLGVASIDLIGWDDEGGKPAHLEREQTLLRAGETLINIFGDENVFRVATGEFIALDEDSDENAFDMLVMNAKGLFREHNLLAAIACEWRAQPGCRIGAIDEIIHEAHMKSEAEKRLIVEHRKKRPRLARANGGEEARIPIPRGEDFFRLADQFLSTLFEESIVTVVVDINYFNLYNDIFGRRAGNVFLENIARIASKAAKRYEGVCGYIGGDDFCLMVPAWSDDRREIEAEIGRIYDLFDFPDGFYPVMGVYVSDDRRETAITLYDRALAALSEIKGDYINHVRFYSAESHQHQREDKLLLMNVKEGLANDEFVFYVQPQVHEKTGKIIGGEALVRWVHNGKLIPPGKFIPVLEKTGYVYTVDAHVWESVACWLRELIDRGVKPVPISVNVSKIDFYFCDVGERFISLAEKYGIDPRLIGVEITESAFTDNVDTIIEAVGKLHAAGFHVLMDDFGSGSSSLSMLHTMSLDVLKTDVKFMTTDERDNRAISIVESVISMAHIIGMSVVAEGVETEKQKENLIELGDNFAQGYFFYRPMPPEQFEGLIRDPDNVTAGYAAGTSSYINQLRFKDLIKEGFVSNTLLENIIRAAAVFKVEGEAVTVLQINDSFAELAGISNDEADRARFSEGQRPEEMAKLRTLFESADAHPLGGSEGEIELGPESRSVKIRVFLLYSLDDHSLYLSTMG